MQPVGRRFDPYQLHQFTNPALVQGFLLQLNINMKIAIYQTLNAHAPAIHWWLAQDPRFGPQLYEGREPCSDQFNPEKIGSIVAEMRNPNEDDITEELYEVHQESLRQMENKDYVETETALTLVDCTSDYFNFTKDLHKHLVWSNYFGVCNEPTSIVTGADKVLVAQSTVEQNAMFYITQYAFNEMTEEDIHDHSEVWWKDHMLMSGEDIGDWKEIWYKDYHEQCIQDFHNGKLQYMWQLNFAHWDLENTLHHNSDGKFELDYSIERLFQQKSDDSPINYERQLINLLDSTYLVIDIHWYNHIDTILEYLGVSSSPELEQAAELYKNRFEKLAEHYKQLLKSYN